MQINNKTLSLLIMKPKFLDGLNNSKNEEEKVHNHYKPIVSSLKNKLSNETIKTKNLQRQIQNLNINVKELTNKLIKEKKTLNITSSRLENAYVSLSEKTKKLRETTDDLNACETSNSDALYIELKARRNLQPYHDKESVISASTWKEKYDEIEKTLQAIRLQHKTEKTKKKTDTNYNIYVKYLEVDYTSLEHQLQQQINQNKIIQAQSERHEQTASHLKASINLLNQTIVSDMNEIRRLKNESADDKFLDKEYIAILNTYSIRNSRLEIDTDVLKGRIASYIKTIQLNNLCTVEEREQSINYKSEQERNDQLLTEIETIREINETMDQELTIKKRLIETLQNNLIELTHQCQSLNKINNANPTADISPEAIKQNIIRTMLPPLWTHLMNINQPTNINVVRGYTN